MKIERIYHPTVEQSNALNAVADNDCTADLMVGFYAQHNQEKSLGTCCKNHKESVMKDNLYRVTILNRHGDVLEATKLRINDKLVKGQTFTAFRDKPLLPKLQLRFVARTESGRIICQKVKPSKEKAN